MINNEFHLIGMCVSDFEKLSTKKFACFVLRIEVEKFGGSTFQTEVMVYNSNRNVDTSKQMLGKMVAVNGFVDTFKTDDGSFRIKLVVQNIMYLTSKPKVVETKAEVKTSTAEEFSDDDLPF